MSEELQKHDCGSVASTSDDAVDSAMEPPVTSGAMADTDTPIGTTTTTDTSLDELTSAPSSQSNGTVHNGESNLHQMPLPELTASFGALSAEFPNGTPREDTTLSSTPSSTHHRKRLEPDTLPTSIQHSATASVSTFTDQLHLDTRRDSWLCLPNGHVIDAKNTLHSHSVASEPNGDTATISTDSSMERARIHSPRLGWGRIPSLMTIVWTVVVRMVSCLLTDTRANSLDSKWNVDNSFLNDPPDGKSGDHPTTLLETQDDVSRATLDLESSSVVEMLDHVHAVHGQCGTAADAMDRPTPPATRRCDTNGAGPIWPDAPRSRAANAETECQRPWKLCLLVVSLILLFIGNVRWLFESLAV